MTLEKAGSYGRYSRKENHTLESQQTAGLAQLSPEISPIGMWQSRNITLPASCLKSWDSTLSVFYEMQILCFELIGYALL